ncbi:MAG: hypothetical protein AB1400_09300 [Pseudomonadota bacterium]
MMPHHVLSKTITPPKGQEVDIKYWAEDTKVCVAGFDKSGKRVSSAVYQAEVDIAEHFDVAFQQSLIGGLVAAVESDLLNNPQLHYRP